MIRTRSRRWGQGLLVVLLCASLGGCAVSGLQFREDTRVQITVPADREQVRLPVTVEWQVSDFEVRTDGAEPTPDAGYFAVFVDRAPQPPGEPLDWLAHDDDGCIPSQGCPDDEYFAQRHVFTTADTSIVLEQMPMGPEHRRELHEVTVVLLDVDGRRIGESAFAVQFELLRDT